MTSKENVGEGVNVPLNKGKKDLTTLLVYHTWVLHQIIMYSNKVKLVAG